MAGETGIQGAVPIDIVPSDTHSIPQQVVVPPISPNPALTFKAQVLTPGGKVIKEAQCRDFKIAESGGCVTLYKSENNKRICVGGNASIVVIEEE